MSRRTKRILILVVVLLAAGGWIWRYTTMNAFYSSLHQEVRRTYSMGEIVPIGDSGTKYGMNADGYSVRVDDFAILDLPEFLEEISATEEDLTTIPDKVAVASVTLFREEGQAPGVNLAGFWLHGVDNYAMVDYGLVELANPILRGTGSVGISLSPGTEYSVVVPFGLQRQYFGGDTWRNLEDYRFYFCMSTLGEEKDIRCWEGG